MDNAQKTILIIDDEAHIRRILELKFKKAGFRVLTAKNGEKGLELIESLSPDAVISDINMPKVDGQALCMMTDPLKEKRRFLTIIITARIHPDDQEWIRRMTDTVFMEKPFSPSKILETVNQYFMPGRE
nr:response regulator [uncultured Desulfobacter sp.]